MERILILMQAANWAEATEALTSARENALHRNALSYALVLPEAPTSPEECNMAAFGALQYLVSPEMTFAAMETLWHGERYALLAHPAMRFERDWEKKLLARAERLPGGKRSGGADGLSARRRMIRLARSVRLRRSALTRTARCALRTECP